MNNTLISFCIATFQRYEILKELIMEILSVDSDRFEIIVSDDCSMDNSVEKLKKIQDPRLKIFVNQYNVGSLQNIYEALERGSGRYLFYVNDRDNVDSFKVEKLLCILDELGKKDVAFMKCIDGECFNAKYQIYSPGEETLLAFACRIDHPTGYIFSRDIWHKLKGRKILFGKQCYGDYSITMICAMMALKYSGAYIYGDICDVGRERIDFAKEKSGYYLKRKDKRVWYSPEVQWRELLIAYRFLRNLNVKEALIDKLLHLRYEEYLRRVTIQYKEIISKPENTLHYNLQVSRNSVLVHGKTIWNGVYMLRNMQSFCKYENKKELCLKIIQSTKTNCYQHMKNIYKDLLNM